VSGWFPPGSRVKLSKPGRYLIDAGEDGALVTRVSGESRLHSRYREEGLRLQLELAETALARVSEENERLREQAACSRSPDPAGTALRLLDSSLPGLAWVLVLTLLGLLAYLVVTT
jgi:hypothetical protein